MNQAFSSMLKDVSFITSEKIGEPGKQLGSSIMNDPVRHNAVGIDHSLSIYMCAVRR